MEGTEEVRLTRTDSLFGRQLLRAQKEGLSLESVEELLAAFQDMKELALRQALKEARLEVELRRGGRQEPKTHMDAGVASYCQVAATGVGVPYPRLSLCALVVPRLFLHFERFTMELAALLAESKDPQAIQPEKVGEFLQKTFQPEKLGLKQVKLQKISKMVVVLVTGRGWPGQARSRN